MKIMIIGADGQLGSDLCRVVPTSEQIPLTLKELDITKKDQVLAVLDKYRPDQVINTAAFHRVDDCEEQIELTFAVNVFGVKYLVDACRQIGAVLTQISTDYVFDGEKKSPYQESDVPRPRSVYGLSKLAGEYLVSYNLEKYFLVRSSGLYGQAGCLVKGGGNFVDNIIERGRRQTVVQVVTDEIVSPTYALDLAKKIYQLLQTQEYGLYHIANHGQCSWFEFAQKIFELIRLKVDLRPITAAQFKTKARRPHFSVLQNSRLAELGWDDLRPWSEALRAYLVEKGYLNQP